MKLRDVYKDINKGKVEARLNTAFGYFRIIGVNREDWTQVSLQSSSLPFKNPLSIFILPEDKINFLYLL